MSQELEGAGGRGGGEVFTIYSMKIVSIWNILFPQMAHIVHHSYVQPP